MTLLAMAIVGGVFILGAFVAILALATIARNVSRKLKDTNVNLKDGINADELSVIGKLLAEEAQQSKELELLVKLKSVADKALSNKTGVDKAV